MEEDEKKSHYFTASAHPRSAGGELRLHCPEVCSVYAQLQRWVGLAIPYTGRVSLLQTYTPLTRKKEEGSSLLLFLETV